MSSKLSTPCGALLLSLLVQTAAVAAPAALYHAPPAEVALSPVESEFLALVHSEFKGRAVQAPARCPALTRAARDAAAILAHEPSTLPSDSGFRGDPRRERRRGAPDLPAGEIIRALLQHQGVSDMMTFPFTLQYDGGELPRHDVRAIVERYVIDRRVSHVGVGSSARDGGASLVVLLFVSRMVTLEPLPREVTAEAELTLKGSVPPHYGFPQVLLKLPGGAVVDADVYAIRRGAFRAPLPLTAGPGRYVVEVLTSDEFGPQVANLFSLYKETRAPRVPELRLVPDDPPGGDPEALAVRLLKLLARDRERFGAPPLESHPGLTRAARAHSTDMAFRDYFGHRAPSSGPTPERLARFGIKARAIGETISIAPTTTKAHADLMHSPSHRRVLLDPQMTHVGVGIVSVGVGASRRLVITQKLANLP